MNAPHGVFFQGRKLMQYIVLACCLCAFLRYWEQLAEDMRATGQFHDARLRHTKIRQAHYAGRSVVRPATYNHVPRQRIWAHAARLKTRLPKWQELAWFYVAKGYDRNGVLREIVAELVAGAPQDLKFFGIGKMPAVIRVFLQHGLVPITKAVMPDVEEWAESVGLGNRLPKSALSEEAPDVEQILRLAQDEETAERWLFVQL
ncbi:MAG: hypothetical protein NUV59_01505 [Patescibacteria group bacterium]|nr:hypothetical protein [Patescibacteria group bacterium]